MEEFSYNHHRKSKRKLSVENGEYSRSIKEELQSPKKKIKIEKKSPKTQKVSCVKSEKVSKIKVKSLPKEEIKSTKSIHTFNINYDLENSDIVKKNNKSKNKIETSTSNIVVSGSAWTASELLSEKLNIDVQIAQNLVELLENDNTIPFIARYRRDMVGEMTPEGLRHAKEVYETIKTLQAKAVTIIKTLSKSDKLTDYLERCIAGARSMDELELIYTPYKVGNKRSKAEAARQLGLEETAITILNGTDYVALEPLINENVDGLKDVADVELSIVHIVADIISKDLDVLNFIRRMITQECYKIRIESSQSRTVKSKEISKNQNPDKKKQDKTKEKNQNKDKKKQDKTKEIDVNKYQHYFQFSNSIKNVKPHQILALNRGESQKVLSVKIVIPQWLIKQLEDFCWNHWMRNGFEYPLRKFVFEKSFKDSYSRLIFPFIARTIRSDLNRGAELAAIEVFATNLKSLLLQPPLRGFHILGIDPGFKNGCKIAVITSSGSVLDAEVLYLHFKSPYNVPPTKDENARKLKNILQKHSCEIIALGNGTACRETEIYLSQLIKSDWFRPLDVRYTIVSEQGASIYSCSPEATKEFPNLDPNLISAVSLARRIQDPLSELVKVEPKHLGVGMYQHDVAEKLLSAILDEVVSECVSFVGVDLNTASLSVLKRIAGLNANRASKILEWRDEQGPFTNRQQLKLIKGIGDKTYEQCVGFVRVVPETIPDVRSNTKNKKTGKIPKKSKIPIRTEFNILDQTVIHPESYAIAEKLVVMSKLDINDLGTLQFINRIGDFVDQQGLENLSEQLQTTKAILKQICEGLQKPPDHDIRSELSQPLFRREIKNLNDLKVGTILTGRVQNVTHFGTFVDLGVGTDGLIYSNKLTSTNPQIGDRVEVKVISVEVERKRIGLALVRLI